MLLNKTVNKKILETIVHETFSNFGTVSSSSLLDSLKLLGFHYATNAGISISIEDLKTPDVKKSFIETANTEITFISQQWQKGFVSDTERFQSIIDSWNVATDSLKNRIVDYYQKFDPANNLYIMAFSGARGNMSQVRQLVGMRGLMSDQEGKIIDLPIQANFREGLSSIDYIISSYGARKGIVDTALKTADSGYLTRRLIYVAQDLVIREIDCQTKEGLLVFFNKKTNIKNLIGTTLLNYRFEDSTNLKVYPKEITLTSFELNKFKKLSPLILNIRSALTCKANASICQKCYGWDLATEKLISLGEAVGIIAAQSIGEPGTQLTMRTFHTGGIFTSETLKQIVAPFSGKIILPDGGLKTINYRTNHGTMVLKLQQEAVLKIINWKGFVKEVFLDIDSFLYFNNSTFVKKGQLIAEYSTISLLPGPRRLKPIYTSFAGEIKFENLLIRKTLREKTAIKINQDDGVLWIASGKVLSLPNEIKYLQTNHLTSIKPIAILKINTPYSGIVTLTENNLSLVTEEEKYNYDLFSFSKNIINCSVKISLSVKNYQYVDKHTILGYLKFYPTINGSIYTIRIKSSKYITNFFFITEKDIWTVNSDQVNNFQFFQDKKIVVRSGMSLNSNSKFSRSGFFLKKEGFKMIFQNATPIFLSRGTILNYKHGDFILEKKVLATLVNYTQQTEDIVQGLPKIDELIEARHPKIKAFLSEKPGILLNSYIPKESKEQQISTKYGNNIIKCSNLKLRNKSISSTIKKVKKRSVYITNSLNANFVVLNNEIFNFTNIPARFFLQYSGRDEKDYILKSHEGQKLIINGKLNKSLWQKNNVPEFDNTVYKLSHFGELVPHLKKFKLMLKNTKGDYLALTTNKKFVLLEALNPLQEYQLPLNSKVLFEPGSFIDIGEPITEGIVDIHELLEILFKYHINLDGVLIGTLRSLNKFQLLLVNSIQAIYQSQGVNISSKHIEIIVRQMTGNVVIKETGDTPLIPGEIIKLALMNVIYKTLKTTNKKRPLYEPILMSATTVSLRTDGFLSAAGFQETKKVLTKAAIEGSSDWLRNLKECVIIGRLIPAGSAFLNYKNYLDNIYFFKNN
jgi:hypothetical protein